LSINDILDIYSEGFRQMPACGIAQADRRATRSIATLMSVISIRSQVVYGYVGNCAAAFPMQMHGIEVMAVPTTAFSNRPRCPTVRGQVLDAGLVADLLVGLEERGAVDTCQVMFPVPD
jgi:hypothetical protein